MSKVRHWKEKFAADADFVYSKTMHLGGGVWVKPGDPVDKAALGRNVRLRLRRWWDSRVIRLAEFAAPASALTGRPVPVSVESVQDNAPVDEPVAPIEHKDEVESVGDSLLASVVVEHLGGPWYMVKQGDDEFKIKGRKAAEAKAEELR